MDRPFGLSIYFEGAMNRRPFISAIAAVVTTLFVLGTLDYARYCWFGGEGGLVMRLEDGLPIYEIPGLKFLTGITMFFSGPVLLIALIKAAFFRHRIKRFEVAPVMGALFSWFFGLLVFVYIINNDTVEEKWFVLLFLLIAGLGATGVGKLYHRIGKR